MGARLERARRALTVGRVAHQSGLRRILAEIGVAGHRDATREGARAFRQGLEELGTTFIKLGQLLSSRPDLLPDVYIEELGGLVDDVPPVPFAEIESVLREDFGEGAFVSLDPEPLATASIAQTHRGLLATGQDVVVKVRRPGIVEQVDLDLAVLRSTVRIASRHSESARRVRSVTYGRITRGTTSPSNGSTSLRTSSALCASSTKSSSARRWISSSSARSSS